MKKILNISCKIWAILYKKGKILYIFVDFFLSKWAIIKSITLTLKHPVPVWRPEMGPPNSPNYEIWPMMAATCKKCVVSVPIMMQEASERRLVKCWPLENPQKLQENPQKLQKKSTKIGGVHCQKWQFNPLKIKNFCINYF